MGMRYDDFCRLDVKEFAAIYDSYVTQRDVLYKDAWERTRMIVAVTARAHGAKGTTLHELMSLPWDFAEEEHEMLTPEENQARIEELMKRTKNNGKYDIDNI